jgi:hypothetical protein
MPSGPACVSDVLAIVLDRLEHVLAEIGDVRTEQQRQGETLAAIVRALDRGRGAREAADVALLIAIAEATDDRPFTNTQLLERAATTTTLRDALEACDITNARELGWLCRRLEARPRPDIWIERHGDSHDGMKWRVRVSSSETREP